MDDEEIEAILKAMRNAASADCFETGGFQYETINWDRREALIVPDALYEALQDCANPYAFDGGGAVYTGIDWDTERARSLIAAHFVDQSMRP